MYDNKQLTCQFNLDFIFTNIILSFCVKYLTVLNGNTLNPEELTTTNICKPQAFSTSDIAIHLSSCFLLASPFHHISIK